jgi:hypothetical protein
MKKWIVIAILAVVVLIGALVAAGFALFSGVAHLMDSTDAHVCGLAAVRRSPAAIALVGTPIVQDGFTGGSSSSENGELHERITFTVKGPKGQAFVLATGDRSPLASHLVVQAGRDGTSSTIYSGPFACAELEAHHPR